MGISLLLLWVFVALATAVHIEVSQKKTKLYAPTSFPEAQKVQPSQGSTENAQLRVDVPPRTKSSTDRQTFQYIPDSVDRNRIRVSPERQTFLQRKRHLPLLDLRTITGPRQLRVLGRHSKPANSRLAFSERRSSRPSFALVDSLDRRARISQMLSRQRDSISTLPRIQERSQHDNRFRQNRLLQDDRLRDSLLTNPEAGFVSRESLNRFRHGLLTGSRQRRTWSDANQLSSSLHVTNLRQPFDERGSRDGLTSRRPLFLDRSQTIRVLPPSPSFNRQRTYMYQTPSLSTHSFRSHSRALPRMSLIHEGRSFDSSNMFTPEQILNFERIVPF